jgi:hypothetical protein
MIYTLSDGRSVTVSTEMDRTGTVPCLSIREAGVMGHAPLIASMPRHHVSAPILSALGFTEADAAQVLAEVA